MMCLLFMFKGFVYVNLFCLSLFGLNMYFNRVPHRINDCNDSEIVSPTDGKILNIQTLEDGRYHIMIFLSIFNVHCQWYPVDGLVTNIEYQKGTFAPAYMLQKSKFNEYSQTSIKTKWGIVSIKQIAGQVARRIVNNSTLNSEIRKGDILGKIKLSSRVDVFLPSNVKLNVKKGDNVIGNITKLATFDNVVYMDGVFDMFHVGHLRAIKQMKQYGNKIIIGVIGDEDATCYKRKPIICEKHRTELVAACPYVDDVICPCPLVVNQQFINKYKINHVVHAFSDESDYQKQKNMFEHVEIIQLNYCKDISTSSIISTIMSNNQ